MPEDTPEDEIDAAGFPADDEERLCKLIYVFMVFAFRTAVSLDDVAKFIPYSTLATYRDTMLFWANRIYYQRGVQPPKLKRVLHMATKGIQFAYQTYGFGKRQPSKKHVSIGLEGLRQLLEREISSTTFIENSEQHQVIWCVLRQTGVRPSSIGCTWDHEAHLIWRHLRFTRHPTEAVKISCHITFENLKTNYDDPENAMRQAGHRIFECDLDNPNSENIIFSVPHRLLVIALRRKLLVGIETIDEILEGTRFNIQVSLLIRFHFLSCSLPQIREDAMDQPVFCESEPCGHRLNTTIALSSRGISSFMTDRVSAFGCNQRLNACSLRVTAATDLVD